MVEMLSRKIGRSATKTVGWMQLAAPLQKPGAWEELGEWAKKKATWSESGAQSFSLFEKRARVECVCGNQECVDDAAIARGSQHWLA